MTRILSRRRRISVRIVSKGMMLHTSRREAVPGCIPKNMKGDSPGEKEKANRCPPTGSIYTHCREAATTTLGAKGAVKPENLKNPRPRSGRPLYFHYTFFSCKRKNGYEKSFFPVHS